jgi:DNA-binding HxlR family transcriptional regulator
MPGPTVTAFREQYVLPFLGGSHSSAVWRMVRGVSPNSAGRCAVSPPKVLTQSLRGLERDGLVSRTVHNAPELRVEYALTPLGRSMLEPLAAACAWAAEHWDELLDAREAYKSP